MWWQTDRWQDMKTYLLTWTRKCWVCVLRRYQASLWCWLTCTVRFSVAGGSDRAGVCGGTGIIIHATGELFSITSITIVTRCRPNGTVLARRAVSATPSLTRPATSQPARRQRYIRRQMTTTDDDRRQRGKQYWPIRRASNNKMSVYLILGPKGTHAASRAAPWWITLSMRYRVPN